LYCVRRGVVQDDFIWGDTQTFNVCKTTSRAVAVNTHPITDLLPVAVLLTEKSNHDPTLSLSHAKQKFRLLKDCIVLLRLYCKIVRPDLTRIGACSGDNEVSASEDASEDASDDEKDESSASEDDKSSTHESSKHSQSSASEDDEHVSQIDDHPQINRYDLRKRKRA